MVEGEPERLRCLHYPLLVELVLNELFLVPQANDIFVSHKFFDLLFTLTHNGTRFIVAFIESDYKIGCFSRVVVPLKFQIALRIG